MSSSAAGSAAMRPRVTLTMTGKYTSTAAIIILLNGLSAPNQLFMSGANAMIGIAPAAMPSGISVSLAVAQRAVRNAVRTAATVPMASPPTASNVVACQEAASPNRPDAQLSANAVTIADGFGRMNARRPSAP